MTGMNLAPTHCLSIAASAPHDAHVHHGPVSAFRMVSVGQTCRNGMLVHSPFLLVPGLFCPIYTSQTVQEAREATDISVSYIIEH